MKKLTLALFGVATAAIASVALLNCDGSDPGTDPNTQDLAVENDLANNQTGDMAVAQPDLAGALPPTKLTGFQQPSSVHWDSVSQAWYVSNVITSNLTDPKGFRDTKASISKVPANLSSPNHSWYPETAAQKLSAPFGMRIAGGKLYVGDIDKLWAIDVANPTGVAPVQSAQVVAKGMAALLGYPAFLIDVAVDGSGNIYAADATGRRALKWSVPFAAGAKETEIIAPDTLQGPSGIYIDGSKVILAEAGINQVITKVGGISTCNLDGSGLKRIYDSTKTSLAYQGIEKDTSGLYMIGSPADKVVYGVNPTTGAHAIVRNVGQDGATTAADLGWDPIGKVLAVPDSGANAVYFYKL